MVDKVSHKGREQPVVATVAEQIVYGHGAMAEPAGCKAETQSQLAVGQIVQCRRQATSRQHLWGNASRVTQALAGRSAEHPFTS